MVKRLSLAIAAVAAISAFVVPSTAGAAEATCGSPAKACAVGSAITATGTNFTLNSQFLGKFGCGGLNLKFKVTQNSGGVIKAAGESESPPQTNCRVNSEPFTVETFSLSSLEAKEASGPSGSIKNGTFSFIFKLKLNSGAVCVFTGTNIPFHYVSTASPTVLTSTDPAKDITSTGGCGKAQLEGSFSLETISGATTPVILH